jgi:phage/plasmid-like protein (TIGR03299 family)
MSHELFGDRFFGRQDRPAWHSLGFVAIEDMTAGQAIERLGSYRVAKTDLYARTDDGTVLYLSPTKTILRWPTHDDPQYRYFGVVSEGYNLITLEDAAQIWDKAVKRPVETVGMLSHGSELFITTKLPSLDVRGEEIDGYLLFRSPMNGVDAATVAYVLERVVCRNTLNIALRGATETYRVVHDKTAKAMLEYHLDGVYGRMTEVSGAIKEAFEIMASHRVSKDEEAAVLSKVYPMPAEPSKDAPKSIVEERMARWEQNCVRVDRVREAAKSLFHGDMTGRKKDLEGTSWYLYNSVVETEDYKKGSGEVAAAASLVFGTRAQTKQKAFTECLNISSN